MIRKVLISVLFLALSLYAQMRNEYVTPEIVNSGIKIIDIRTAPEWQQTGIVKNSIPITFFDRFGQYDVKAFLSELDKHVKKGEKFAIICRTGSRTGSIVKFLSDQGYNVINLQGGVMSLTNQGYKLSPYKD